ncbi:MAG: LysR family transcriptional regulator [Burkholderiaceae bacterium]|nr:LysR family transcriptional regulator [Burkholderiaceae bacterium]
MKLVIQPTLLLKTPNYHQRTLDLTHIGNLLRSVDQGRTLAAAAKDLNVSYRTVWNELREAEQELGCKLLERIKGHGSKITPAGQLLIHSLDRFNFSRIRYMKTCNARFIFDQSIQRMSRPHRFIVNFIKF